ncbi:hypothetical protein IX319_002712 [Bacteroides pyogenes]|nr:hypothetical protein [Bacteroides pyogenes]MBR8781785.1 hypothetical protein [Bacteroides pyogenes]
MKNNFAKYLIRFFTEICLDNVDELLYHKS